MADRHVCYVHIGAPKTGSTFLQRFFFENRKELRRRGVLYPDVSLRGFGHHDLAYLLAGGYPDWATAQPRTLPDLAADLAAAAASHSGSILLCSEVFYLFAKPAALKQLLEQTGLSTGRSVRIVVNLRRQDDAHESWYNQCVKAQGESGKIEDSVARYDSLWDYQQQLGLWAEAFSREALVVRRYPPPPGELGLIDDALAILGIAGMSARLPQSHVNVSVNRDILAFQREFNRLALSPQEKRHFHRELMTLSARARGLGIFDERPLLDAPRRKAIIDRYEAGNAAVAKQYLGGGPLFTTDGAQAVVATPAADGLTDRKMIYILGWLLNYRQLIESRPSAEP